MPECSLIKQEWNARASDSTWKMNPLLNTLLDLLLRHNKAILKRAESDHSESLPSLLGLKDRNLNSIRLNLQELTPYGKHKQSEEDPKD